MKKVEIGETDCNKEFTKDDFTPSGQYRVTRQIEHEIPQLCRVLLWKRVPVP